MAEPDTRYPTSTETKCFINGYWVDDLHRIEYQEQNKKVPLQGYHQKHFAAVADGQSIVVGSMTVIHRYPGYLLAAIAGVTRDNDVEPADPKERTRVNEAIRYLRNADPAERVKFLANASPKQFELYSELLEATFNGSPKVRATSAVDLTPAELPNGFDATIYYYRGAAPVYARKLIGIHMTGQNAVLSAGMGGGDLGGSGQPLYENYSFFARRWEEVSFTQMQKQLRRLSEVLRDIGDTATSIF
jgi:hypothetical protein